MILLCVFSFFIFLLLAFAMVVLFFNHEKKKHEVVLLAIEENIASQKKILCKQQEQLENLSFSIENSEINMKKVVQEFQKISFPEEEFLQKHLKNLSIFSENSKQFLQIYGRFVKIDDKLKN